MCGSLKEGGEVFQSSTHADKDRTFSNIRHTRVMHGLLSSLSLMMMMMMMMGGREMSYRVVGRGRGCLCVDVMRCNNTCAGCRREDERMAGRTTTTTQLILDVMATIVWVYLQMILEKDPKIFRCRD